MESWKKRGTKGVEEFEQLSRNVRVMWLPHTRRTLFKLVCCLQTFLIIFVLLTKDKISQRRARMSRTFAIDLAGDTFRLNGDPFQWRRIMRAMRAAGLNALSTYVEWRSHEVHPGHYHYDGHRDIEHFLQLAVEEDLYILLRPGPFICGERDFGCFPPWSLKVAPDILLRQNHPVYQRYVTRWFQELFPRIQKYLYGNATHTCTEIENVIWVWHVPRYEWNNFRDFHVLFTYSMICQRCMFTWFTYSFHSG